MRLLVKKEIFLIYSNEYSMQITNQNYSIYNQTFYKKIEDIVVYYSIKYEYLEN